jgi:uncharacterized protein (TIGR03435 family)
VKAAALAAMLMLTGPVPGAAQPSATPAQFAAATVRRNVSGEQRVDAQTSPGGRVAIINTTIRDLIRNVFGLADFQISGGPDWLAHERYDVVATAGADVPRQQLMLMIRGLLAERLKLAFHYELRDTAVYALRLARADQRPGPQLRPTAIDCTAASTAAARDATQRACGFDVSGGSLTATGMSIASLTQRLASISGRIVADQTGLPGLYDLQLRWAPDGVAAAGGDGPSLFTALREQLGLKLDDAREPVQMMVIDHAERPTP